MKKITLLLVFTLCMQFVNAQTQFWSDSFEDTGAPSSGTRTPSFSGGFGTPYTRYFIRCQLSDISLQASYTNIQGTKFWAGEDIDAAPAGVQGAQSSIQNVTWTGINISGKTGLSFKGYFATSLTTVWDHGSSTTQTDYIVVYYRIDGGSWTQCLAFYPNVANGFAIPMALDTDNDGVGDGTILTAAFTEFTANIPGTGSTLELRVEATSNTAGEELAFDQFRLFETINTTTTWNGTTWSNGAPTAATDAIIASSVTPGSFTCKALTINSGVALTMNSGATAYINGNLTNSGNGFSGTGTFNFAASSTLSGNAISCAGTVTVASGATLTTAGLLTFTSDATNTGRIGNSAGTISGIVNTQRYIPGGRRAFRFLAHPFNAAQSMSALTDDIDITGSGGSPFTTTGSNNPSAFYFDVAAGDNTTTGNNPGWTAFTASSTWAQYQAMRVLVRGAKGEGLTSGAYTPSAATIDMSGSVNQGNQTISLTKGSGTNFVLVGNPFQSQINMDAVSGTNIGSSFYIWNANQGTRGAYTSYTFGSSSFNLPAGGAFVTTLSASGSVVIEEADKTNNTPGIMLKTTGIANQVELKLEDSTIFWDRLLLNFDDNAMATVDYPDAAKLYNPDMTFYTLSKDDSMLSIDTRPYVANETIKLGLYAGIKKDFKFTAPNVNMPAGTKLYFTDKLLSKTIEVTPAFEYWFTVDTSSASWGNNRFELNTQGIPTSSIANVNASKLKVKLVPNPTTDNVTLYYEGAGKELNIIVTNMMGVKVATATATNINGNVTIPTAQLANGVYNVTIHNGSEVMTQKLIKQ